MKKQNQILNLWTIFNRNAAERRKLLKSIKSLKSGCDHLLKYDVKFIMIIDIITPYYFFKLYFDNNIINIIYLLMIKKYFSFSVLFIEIH